MILTSSLDASSIIKSFFIIIALLMFRNFITHIIIKLIRKLTEKYQLKSIGIIIDSIEKPLLIFITYTAIYLGLIIFPFNASISLFLNKVYRTFIIITVTQVLLRGVTLYSDKVNDNYINEKKGKTQITKTVFPILSKLIKTIIIIIAFVAIAMEFNFKQLSSVLAGLGIGGAALALASQDLIKNFFGGFVILTDKSFSVGDWIKVDSFEGTVEELGLRSTKIRTIGKEVVIIPNSRFTDREVINYSIRENRRDSFTLSISYKTSSEKINNVINKIKEMLDSHLDVKENSSLVKLSSFGQSGVEIIVQYLTNTADYTKYMDIKNNIYFKIIDIFIEEEIQFAIPTMNIYVNK